MKKYIVSISYFTYVFFDRLAALKFAETALDTQEDKHSVTITIEQEVPNDSE